VAKKEDRIKKLQRLTDELDEFLETEFPEYIEDIRRDEAEEFEQSARRYHRRDVRSVPTERASARPGSKSSARK
jgi:hypothetical protein